MRYFFFQMRISHISLSKPNLIIHPAIFPPLSLDTVRPLQTASAGADTVSAGLNRPSMDEMPAICCVYTLRLFSCTLLTAFDALMISPRLSGLLVRCSPVYSGVSRALLSRQEFPRFSTSNRSMSGRGVGGGGVFWGRVYFWQTLSKAVLSLSSRQSNTSELCSSCKPLKDHVYGISASLDEVETNIMIWF